MQADTVKHQLEMSPDRDFPGAPPVRFRYAILSTPRSGSTLLGRALHETKMAGDPLELFNTGLLAYARKRLDRPTLGFAPFLRLMEARRTSPNGVFGIKMHLPQLLRVCSPDDRYAHAARFLRGMDRLVWIRRRDRLAQAISKVIADKTEIWTSEEARRVEAERIEVHPGDCLKMLHQVCSGDAGWENLLRAQGFAACEVWYEDLVAGYEAEMRRVLDWLGLEAVRDIPPPPIERQAGELNERLRRELHAYLGLAAAQ